MILDYTNTNVNHIRRNTNYFEGSVSFRDVRQKLVEVMSLIVLSLKGEDHCYSKMIQELKFII